MKPRRHRPFVDLSPAEIPFGTDPGEERFLGRFDHPHLRRELEESGILEKLAHRGYPNVAIRIDVESNLHRLRVVPHGGRVNLIDLRLSETSAVAEDLAKQGLDVVSLLSVHWLALQDPLARFTSDKPRLPGQRYPGLGLGAVLYSKLAAWATSWGKDGLMSIPAYFHNAVLYGSVSKPVTEPPRAEPAGRTVGARIARGSLFLFFSPLRQGRFEALCRDLAALTVAEASNAVESGRVLDRVSNRPFGWESAEMIAPSTSALRAYIRSNPYRQAVQKARDEARFSLLG